MYITLREVNQIIVFDRKAKRIVQRYSTLGDHLVICNCQRMDVLSLSYIVSVMTSVFLKEMKKAGLLQPLRAKLHVQEGVCIVFEQEES